MLAVAFYESLGKKVIVPRRERVGHAANRLQAALLREAFALAIDGTLDVPQIDAILTHGLALRWACAGPFALTELGGGAAADRNGQCQWGSVVFGRHPVRRLQAVGQRP